MQWGQQPIYRSGFSRHQGSPSCDAEAVGAHLRRLRTCYHPVCKTGGSPDGSNGLIWRAKVAHDAEELRGGLRFMAALFKERLLPHALVQSLAADLAAHTAAGGPVQLHCQPLLAVALVALLQVGLLVWGLRLSPAQAATFGAGSVLLLYSYCGRVLALLVHCRGKGAANEVCLPLLGVFRMLLGPAPPQLLASSGASYIGTVT